jgi:sugar O-acyltransferase (sialic acid O-acetyltransferase NeuD family)
MTPREIYVAGTGSFALEVVEYASASGHDVAGLVELADDARIGAEIHGLGVVSAVDGRGRNFVVGAAGDRLAYAAYLETQDWEAAVVVHPSAHVSPSARLGPGIVAAPRVVIGAAAELGPHVLVGRGALIGHHTIIGAGVTINPGANVAGNVSIGDGATIGMGAQISNGIEIGASAIVAAGAVVVRPVDAETRVQGVPARVFGA